MVEFPVIIIGAGPAGSSCAHQLSKSGIGNVILEKEKLPRPKVCAGGIPLRLNKLISFDISHLVHRQVRQILFVYGRNKKFTLSSPDPFVYTVNRTDFDYCLVQEAVDEGTAVYEGTKVERIEAETVYTNKGTLKAQYIVDAGGVGSPLSRRIQPKKRWVTPVQAEVKVPSDILEEYREKIRADLSLVPLGWAWVFPKKNYLTVGIGSIASSFKGRPLSDLLKTYLSSLFSSYEIGRIESYPVSLPSWTNNVAKNNFILIGDAGNFVDPLIGEGIYWAIKSGKLAADFLEMSIRERKRNCEEFNMIAQKEIFRSLRRLLLTSTFFYRAPWFFLEWGRKSDRMRQRLVGWLQGEM